jgi:tRNA nucleotidyltransferase/poly(A) polymerase
MFEVLSKFLESQKFEIFLSTPECFTIRARFPEGHQYSGVADFVMARKEIGYVEGTRTPIVQPGTLYDDLERRDFTLNALAKDENGEIIDFFKGLRDLEKGILRTPLPCEQTFDDDPLRILRAIRFSITKGFTIPKNMWSEIYHYDYERKMKVVSEERIKDELFKCFKHDTLETWNRLNVYPRLRDYIFSSNKLWLKPTFEQ